MFIICFSLVFICFFFAFLQKVNLDSKIYFNREEKFKNEKAKRSKEEPRKNQ